MRIQSKEEYGRTTAEGWNRAHREGWGEGLAPAAFLETILTGLNRQDIEGRGLYVGCGDGRNYLELLRQRPGLNLEGVDISDVGIGKLREKAPETEPLTRVEDFTRASYINTFDYLIAIQSFQNGDRDTTARFFAGTRRALKSGGKLFLAVNSVSTDIIEDYDFIEGSRSSGIVVRFKSGNKEGQYLHYYSKKELGSIAARNSFKVILGPVERSYIREDGRGRWVQWETVWQKI
jgi:SAM-dependent methyltransferase